MSDGILKREGLPAQGQVRRFSELRPVNTLAIAFGSDPSALRRGISAFD
jgi:hypothetical protein